MEATGYDPVVNSTDSNSSDLATGGGNTFLQVEFFSAVTWFGVILLLVGCGIAGNVTVILTARCRQRSRYFRRRLIYDNLCVAQFLLCVVAAPLRFAAVVGNYVGNPQPGIICQVGIGLDHVLLTATVLCLVQMALSNYDRMANRMFRSGGEQTGNETKCIFPVGLHFALPWIGGIAAAIFVTASFAGGSGICSPSDHNNAFLLTSFSLSTVYALALGLIVLILALRYLFREKEVSKSSRKKVEKQNCLLEQGVEEEAHGSGSEKGAQSPVLDDDDEDDTFDTRMRLTFLKKCRSSGRRHTVANIGLPDMPGVRRGSLENGSRKRKCERKFGCAQSARISVRAQVVGRHHGSSEPAGKSERPRRKLPSARERPIKIG